VRPNLLFYDEKLPQKYWKNLDKISEADLIMIMGTSL
jgi:NAD-dependent SIR2 family protein deacetylase